MKKCTNPRCKRAGQLLPLEDFHNRVSNKDGLETRCKECIREVNKRNKVALASRYSTNWESIVIGDKPVYYFLND